MFNFYTPIAFACNEAIENCSKYFPMKDTGHVTEKLTVIFFRLFMVFHRTSQNLHVTSVFHFPTQKQSELQSLNK